MLRLIDKLRPRLLASLALRDTADYLGITIDEAMDQAQEARARHKAAWYTRERYTEQDIQSFYGEDNNYLFSLPMHWRMQTWHFIPRLSPGNQFLEYGCGTAEMTAWLLRHYPQNEYTVADLAVASTLPFVRHRFKEVPVTILEIGEGKAGLPLCEEYSFIACVDVLEHCVSPIAVIEHLYNHLVVGGILYTTYPVEREQIESGQNSENLRESALQRGAVISFLESNTTTVKAVQRLEPSLEGVLGWDALGIYRKV
jgi:SAM-dependent methyltransferase